MTEEITDAPGRVYELGFLLVPTITEEDLPKKVSEIKDLVMAHATESISEAYPWLIDLAYAMEHSIDGKAKQFDRAYFGWMKFAASAEQAKALEEALRTNADTIRSIVVKTVRENTVAAKRSYKGETLKRKNEGLAQSAEREEIDSVAVDKKIDELVEQDA